MRVSLPGTNDLVKIATLRTYCLRYAVIRTVHSHLATMTPLLEHYLRIAANQQCSTIPLQVPQKLKSRILVDQRRSDPRDVVRVADYQDRISFF